MTAQTTTSVSSTSALPACGAASATATSGSNSTCADPYGNTFNVTSGTRYVGTVSVRAVKPNLNSCLTTCDTTSGCQAANYNSTSGEPRGRSAACKCDHRVYCSADDYHDYDDGGKLQFGQRNQHWRSWTGELGQLVGYKSCAIFKLRHGIFDRKWHVCACFEWRNDEQWRYALNFSHIDLKHVICGDQRPEQRWELLAQHTQLIHWAGDFGQSWTEQHFRIGPHQ
ncbi:hypothetical protein B0A55_08282 [Friedmanniomyces simplex]|uniref:Apple domain-containing protein n=1 Tax=Friedmanniomyces simplex TaxID=329884 RepID=A0A4U0WP86_9PEZI|nr:hypothetical protein B0A55_08282 [Friedmanniomyces simplex]